MIRRWVLRKHSNRLMLLKYLNEEHKCLRSVATLTFNPHRLNYSNNHKCSFDTKERGLQQETSCTAAILVAALFYRRQKTVEMLLLVCLLPPWNGSNVNFQSLFSPPNANRIQLMFDSFIYLFIHWTQYCQSHMQNAWFWIGQSHKTKPNNTFHMNPFCNQTAACFVL